MNIHIDSPTVILLPLASFTSFFVLNIIEVWLIYSVVSTVAAVEKSKHFHS